MMATQFTFRKLPVAALLPAALFLQTVAEGCKSCASPKAQGTAAAPATAATAVTTPAEGQAEPGSLAERLAAVQSGQADGTGKPTLPRWKPAKSGTSFPTIPLIRGLVLVTAIGEPGGDYESIKSIQDVSPSSVQMGISADMLAPKMTGLLEYKGDQIYNPKNHFHDHVACTRIIDAADLASAHGYAQNFCEEKKCQ